MSVTLEASQPMSLDAFIMARGRNKRLARLTHDVVLPVAHGLEFGPGDQPTSLPDTCRVEYVDHRAGASERVAIDWVWTGGGSLAEVCGAAGVYDFAIAAQVAQYVPNLCGWFRGIHEVMRPGGVMNLTIPDKRLTFDINRKESTLGEVVEAYYQDYARPSLRQMFDHTFAASAIDPQRLWQSDVDPATLPRLCGEHALALAHDQARAAWREGRYELCHCWVFTPLSFLDLLEGLTRLGLFPFVISQFASTEPGDFEFFVSIRRDAEADPDRLRALQLGAIDHVRSIARRQRQAARRLSV